MRIKRACSIVPLALSALVARSQVAAPVPAPSGTAGTADQAVQLSPFDVQAQADKGYSALNSNSITGFNAALSKLPLSADVFDQTFMKDVAVTTVEGLIQGYSAGAGFTDFDPASASATNQPGDRTGNTGLALRGLMTTVTQRDGFMPAASTGVGYTSNFDLDRVELINGPQALLYGAGGAGGVVNLDSKQALLGRPAFGSTEFQVDEYGTKLAQFDYGAGNDVFALRLAVLDQDQKVRRVNLGGHIDGYYGQIAIRPIHNTTIRITGEDSTYFRITGYASAALTAPTGTGGDPRNGELLNYLLATNQAGATNPATGAAYPSGALFNGYLNWQNVDSFDGWQASELTNNKYVEASIDTDWNPHLSTHVAVGYDQYWDDHTSNGTTWYAPGASGNTLGVWAAALTPGDTITPERTKGIRLSALLKNDFFGGAVHSQTSLGADNIDTLGSELSYLYFQADSNFNVIYGAANTLNGRTSAPKILFPINNGPQMYPLFTPGSNQIVINGVNYVRQLQNPVNPNAITPNDPLGVTLGGGNYQQIPGDNRGIYGLNYSQWLDDRLDTLVGFRVGKWYASTIGQGTAPSLTSPNTNADRVSQSNTFSFDAGADYTINQWLHPYITASQSVDPPSGDNPGPYGELPVVAHGLGEEAGLKFDNSDHTLSGSLAFYHVRSKNEQLVVSSTTENDINPSGLNGRWNAPNQWISVDRQSEGLQATITANPTPNWRMRLSAADISGKIGNTVQYAQLYNDQFHENSAGQVTYANGTPVYVNGTATTAGAATEVAPTAAGATPLTVSTLSNANSVYYANPVAITGQINAGSAAGKILLNPLYAATNGPVLTGVTGLPISQIQINPGFTPPGVITAVNSGDDTTGYPAYSLNFTNFYTIPTGWFKGFSIGENVHSILDYRYYYYYANGITTTATGRTLLFLPNATTVDLILGYQRKFKRITWTTQLNVNNMFNHYQIVLLPNENTGFNTVTAINATFSAQPRLYVWTNTISF